ncbi:MAG: hypothetical protein BRD48_07065 [Bacteroidetes bacterium QS_9_68_14]|nr:MAG: hypothetical protein BRD48_07065 [Bacteroidetes bacterium QS_9_68_14]
MPFCFNIDSKLDLCYTVAEGRITTRQVARLVAAFPAEPAFHEDIDTIYDIPASAQVDLEGDEAMDTLAETVRAVRARQPYHVASVVRTQEHETLFQAAMAILSPKAEVRTFGERADALAWLGHDPARTTRLRRARARMDQERNGSPAT